MLYSYFQYWGSAETFHYEHIFSIHPFVTSKTVYEKNCTAFERRRNQPVAVQILEIRTQNKSKPHHRHSSVYTVSATVSNTISVILFFSFPAIQNSFFSSLSALKNAV